MTRGKTGRKSQKPELNADGDEDRYALASELTEEVHELAAANPSQTRDTSPSCGKEAAQSTQDMANSETILRELRDFRRENTDTLKEIKDELRETNHRIDTAEMRLMEAEERLQHMEDATFELLELQKQFENRLVDQEGRSRRENIRIHGVKEGAEDSARGMIDFIETLLREKLELPPSHHLGIERAHRAFATRPPPDAPPRSIVVRFMSFRNKEEIIKIAWQKRGFVYEGRKVFLDHDYAPDVLKKRKEYTEAKKVLREKKIRFQTPFPAKLRVFYEGEIRVYNTAEEATTDMVRRGFQVTVAKPVESGLERIKRLTWQVRRAEKSHTPRETEPGYKQKLNVFRRNQDKM